MNPQNIVMSKEVSKLVEISLRACRINAKMNQAEFGKAIGVSSATIYNWESGNTEPSLSQLRKISEITGVPIDNIAVGSDSIIMNTNS
jgi:DNA-binding XRE family transcriptional regulator